MLMKVQGIGMTTSSAQICLFIVAIKEVTSARFMPVTIIS